MMNVDNYDLRCTEMETSKTTKLVKFTDAEVKLDKDEDYLEMGDLDLYLTQWSTMNLRVIQAKAELCGHELEIFTVKINGGPKKIAFPWDKYTPLSECEYTPGLAARVRQCILACELTYTPCGDLYCLVSNTDGSVISMGTRVNEERTKHLIKREFRGKWGSGEDEWGITLRDARKFADAILGGASEIPLASYRFEVLLEKYYSTQDTAQASTICAFKNRFMEVFKILGYGQSIEEANKGDTQDY